MYLERGKYMVQINEVYGVETDSEMNYMLMKKYTKKNGEEDMKCIGYYPTFEKLMMDLCRKEIMGTGFKDLQTVEKKFAELKKLIKDLKVNL
jgi:hypothetical protein